MPHVCGTNDSSSIGRRFLPLLPLLVALVPCARGGDYVLYDDVQVPASRHYRGLSNAGVTDFRTLWQYGQVNYFIDETGTNPRNPAPPFPQADLDIIARALMHWESNTCIRFVECAREASCLKPYIRFQSDRDKCNSPVGVSYTQINEINLSSQCGFGAAVHEIGHSLGLGHEQSRNDRDDFVYIDYSQIRQGFENNFDKSGNTGRAIGAYDFGSIMHYDAFSFNVGSRPTIVSAYPMGQRSGLSRGDIEGIQYIYNNCGGAPTTPTCIASQDVDITHVIPYDKEWRVEFNGIYEATMTVDYGGSTVDRGMLVTTVRDGGTIRQAGKTTMQFTPDASVRGREFVLAATFSGSSGGGGGGSATCRVRVKVADARSVCFGISANDPAVCSGRGGCVDNPLQPCRCEAEYGGVDCSAFYDCPMNMIMDFDEDTGSWSGIGNTKIDPGFGVDGASWKVGDESNPNGQGAQGQLTLVSTSRPGKISFYLAWMTEGQNDPSLSFRDKDGQACLDIRIVGSSFYAAGRTGGPPITPGRFYRIDINMVWARREVTYLVDGQVVNSGNIECGTGIDRAVFFGNGWMDDFKLMCSNYIVMTGSVTTGVDLTMMRDGGSTITLTMVGDFDEWVDTRANKHAVIGSLLADRPGGWNARKAGVVDVDMVAINGQALTIGPFTGDAGWDVAASNVVSFDLVPAMFRSGRSPIVAKEDVSFTIVGACAASVFKPYDTPASLPSRSASLSTTVKKEGAGSLWIDQNAYGIVFPESVGGIRPARASAYINTYSAEGQFTWNLGAVQVGVGFFGGNRINDRQIAARPTPGDFAHYEILFDWANARCEVFVDGASQGGFDLKDTKIGETTYSAFYDVYIDEVAYVCEERPGSFQVIPGCPTPGEDATTVTVFPGTDPTSNGDLFAIVPGGATDCADAQAQCAALNGCSDSTGGLVQQGAGVEWDIGLLAGLAPRATYRICHYSRGAAKWALLAGTLTTCGDVQTDEPPTPAPPTHSPPTPSPSTPAPPTLSPPTPAPPPTPLPPTPSPPTPLPVVPPTPTPPTPLPPTPAPPTQVPPTQSPPTPAPPTPAPPSPSPPTPAPQTMPPPTPSPPTMTPPTPAPPSPSPPTPHPPTPVPPSPSPPSPAPLTPTPPSPAPPTIAPPSPAPEPPPTMAPPTPSPTPSPPSPAPLTLAPPSPVPPTLAPPTDGPPTPLPETMSPPTPLPPTPQPVTPAPPTPAPQTGVPPGPETPTPLPSTMPPITLAPRTDPPPTPAPFTQAPPTPLPPTTAPPTPAPLTMPPSTPSPPTLVPPTPAPPSPAPETMPPPTPAPTTDAPSTTVPPTTVPLTPAPPTPSPPTAAPSTAAPVLPTSVPETPLPATAVPGTTDEPATLVPAAKTAAPAPTAPPCVDAVDCTQWVDLGWCGADGPKLTFMQSQCPAACGWCGSGGAVPPTAQPAAATVVPVDTSTPGGNETAAAAAGDDGEHAASVALWVLLGLLCLIALAMFVVVRRWFQKDKAEFTTMLQHLEDEGDTNNVQQLRKLSPLQTRGGGGGAPSATHSGGPTERRDSPQAGPFSLPATAKGDMSFGHASDALMEKSTHTNPNALSHSALSSAMMDGGPDASGDWADPAASPSSPLMVTARRSGFGGAGGGKPTAEGSPLHLAAPASPGSPAGSISGGGAGGDGASIRRTSAALLLGGVAPPKSRGAAPARDPLDDSGKHAVPLLSARTTASVGALAPTSPLGITASGGNGPFARIDSPPVLGKGGPASPLLARSKPGVLAGASSSKSVDFLGTESIQDICVL